MSKQVARVTWSRGCYSDVFWTAIVDPSPIKEGQQVRVIWGKRRKEFSAVLTSYPLVEEQTPAPKEAAFQPRQAKAKRKLVSFIFFSIGLF